MKQVNSGLPTHRSYGDETHLKTVEELGVPPATPELIVYCQILELIRLGVLFCLCCVFFTSNGLTNIAFYITAKTN